MLSTMSVYPKYFGIVNVQMTYEFGLMNLVLIYHFALVPTN